MHSIKYVGCFTYLFWRVDGDTSAMQRVGARLQGLIDRLYEWLGLTPPQINPPKLVTGASPLNEFLWIAADDQRTGSSGREGRAEVVSQGPTITATFESTVEGPITEENFASLKSAHPDDSRGDPAVLGSCRLLGFAMANVEDDLTSLLPASNAQSLGLLEEKPEWSKWIDPKGGGTVWFCPLKTTQLRTLLAKASAEDRDARAAYRFAHYIVPSLARCALRVDFAFKSMYVMQLERPLGRVSSELEAVDVKSDSLNDLDLGLERLSDRIAALARLLGAFETLKQAVQADLGNIERLVEHERLPHDGWIAALLDEMRYAREQLESDSASYRAVFQRATTMLTALGTKATILRTRAEVQQADAAANLTYVLTALGLILGLAQVIDRQHGEEFVGFVASATGLKLPSGGIVLFVGRTFLVLALSAAIFVVGWMMGIGKNRKLPNRDERA